jgi:hypothetical protein
MKIEGHRNLFALQNTEYKIHDALSQNHENKICFRDFERECSVFYILRCNIITKNSIL